jgi:hypothetical protein
LHLCLLTLRGQFLSVLLRYMPSDEATADRADYRVMAGVVPRHSAHDCSFQATRRVRRAGHCRTECHCCKRSFDKTRFHLKSTVLLRLPNVVWFVFYFNSRASA